MVCMVERPLPVRSKTRNRSAISKLNIEKALLKRFTEGLFFNAENVSRDGYIDDWMVEGRRIENGHLPKVP